MGPNFTCRALITQEEVQEQETAELINKMFSGSPELFFSTFINSFGINNIIKKYLTKILIKPAELPKGDQIKRVVFFKALSILV